ncbi:MAG TPA: hypothetical protein EYP60_01150, partial [bacterium (Candidatus Stahlbacteria)]|nr:hypothetical protein [Candidatus Stahlbacteria bacterium]
MIKEFSITNFKCFEYIVTKPWERVNLVAGKNNIGKTALLEAIWMHEGAHNAELALRVEQFRGITGFNNKDFLSDLFAEFKSEKEIILKAKYQDGKTLTLKIIQEESKELKPIIETPEIQGSANIAPITPKVIFEGSENGNNICKSEFFLALNQQGRPQPFSLAGKKMVRPSAVFVSTGFSKEAKNKMNAERFSEQVERKRKRDIIEALKIIDDRLQDLALSKRGVENFVCGDIGYNKMLPLSLMGEGMERY